jgi:hypothetical protein
MSRSYMKLLPSPEGRCRLASGGDTVPDYIHLVFSDPPDGVSEAEFNEWYDAHVKEILSVDGWRSATRYRLGAVVDAESTGGYRYLSVYELDCPPDTALANLAAAGMGNADTYIEKKGKDEGWLPLPDWFAGIRFGSWNCERLGDTITT